MKKKIYVIEDDENIRSLIKIALTGSGYDVKDFETAEEAIVNAEEDMPSLMLFDIMLPGISGTEAVARLKANNKLKRTSVIMLTAKDSELDKIKGLDNGADDYITKPFSIMELMARIRAVLRRAEYSENDESKKEIVGGIIAINTDARTVYVENKQVILTFKEYELLKFFMKNKNRVITRDELLNKVWGYEYIGETRTVDIHIMSLRQKLGKAASYIKTSRGSGYIFEVRE